MAKIPKPSTEQILRMPISELRKLDIKTLKSYISRIGDTANKRAERIANRGWFPTANAYLFSSGGRISVKGKDTQQQLIREFSRARSFLNMKTSTVKGAQKQMKYASERIGGELTDEQSKDFWSAYRRIEDAFSRGAIQEYYGSDELQSYMRNEMLERDLSGIDDIFKAGYDEFERAYEDARPEEHTDFFTL